MPQGGDRSHSDIMRRGARLHLRVRFDGRVLGLRTPPPARERRLRPRSCWASEPAGECDQEGRETVETVALTNVDSDASTIGVNELVANRSQGRPQYEWDRCRRPMSRPRTPLRSAGRLPRPGVGEWSSFRCSLTRCNSSTAHSGSVSWVTSHLHPLEAESKPRWRSRSVNASEVAPANVANEPRPGPISLHETAGGSAPFGRYAVHALVAGVWSFTGTGPDGKPLTLTGRNADVLRRQAGLRVPKILTTSFPEILTTSR